MEAVNSKKLWESVLVEIELNVSKANFNTWFRETYIQKVDGNTAYLAVPNTFVKEWLSQKYHNFLLRLLRQHSEDIRSLEYVISNKKTTTSSGSNSSAQTTGNFSANNTATPSSGGELPLEEYYINKDDNLNPRYDFDSFIVGLFNELAYAAAQAILKKPGAMYNPFFVYGDTGHGKTHLIQAIGNHLKEGSKKRKIYYITSERFGIEFVNAIQSKKVNNFKEKYRKYDVLIMDDIQFFSGKEKTQEELFHLFNNMYDHNKQIVFSSDKHPNYIPGLEDRLKSRFAAGMIVDIPTPDKESRAAIIREKSKFNGVELGDDVVSHIAFSVEGNVRDLEGIINSIACQQELQGRKLTREEVEKMVKNSEKPKRVVSPEEVIKTITKFYGVEEDVIYQKTRRKEVIKPRQMIMYVMREDFGVSYPSIGQKLGGRDHTTVIHSCEKIKEVLKTDTSLTQELSQIRILLS